MSWSDTLARLASACTSERIGGESLTFTLEGGGTVTTTGVALAVARGDEQLEDGSGLVNGATFDVPTADFASSPLHSTVTRGGVTYFVNQVDRSGNLFHCKAVKESRNDGMVDGTLRRGTKN